MKVRKVFYFVEIHILIVIFIFTFFPKYLIPTDYFHSAPSEALLYPSSTHLLGTDDLGFDIFSQLLYGGKISLKISFFTALLSAVGGSILGIFAGYYGGWKDRALIYITGIFLSIPVLPLMIVLGTFLGSNLKNIIFVLALVTWTHPAKISRNYILKIKNEKYILLSKGYGAGFLHIFKWHLLKPMWSTIMTSIIKIMNKAVLAEASLAYLGLGDPLSKSWGMIISRAMSFPNIYFTPYYKWWLFPPVILLIVLVLSLSSLSRKLES